jgi:hypothetical protein
MQRNTRDWSTKCKQMLLAAIALTPQVFTKSSQISLMEQARYPLKVQPFLIQVRQCPFHLMEGLALAKLLIIVLTTS